MVKDSFDTITTMIKKIYRGVLLAISVAVIIYAAFYLLGYDPGVTPFDNYRGIKRGLSRLTVGYSIALLPVLIKPKFLWPLWAKIMIYLLPISALAYWLLSDDSMFSPGPIGAARLVVPAFIVVSWIALGAMAWCQKRRPL